MSSFHYSEGQWSNQPHGKTHLLEHKMVVEMSMSKAVKAIGVSFTNWAFFGAGGMSRGILT